MGYDRGDSFSFDFGPNGIPFGLKSKGKLSPRSYPIQCERNWKYSFLSAAVLPHFQRHYAPTEIDLRFLQNSKEYIHCDRFLLNYKPKVINSVWLIIRRKTVTTIMFLLIWKIQRNIPLSVRCCVQNWSSFRITYQTILRKLRLIFLFNDLFWNEMMSRLVIK